MPFAFLLSTAVSSAATITVTSTADTVADDGVCTLREAINSANSNTASGAMAGECAAGQAGPTIDVIEFNITGGCATICTIAVASSPFPTFFEPIDLDGYSQPGASVNTLAVGDNAVLKIELDGTAAGPLAGGLINIDGGSSTVRGLVINRAGSGNSGVRTNSSNNKIVGNFIGTDSVGAIDLGNNVSGVLIAGGTGNVVGTAALADRNVISGNQFNGANLANAGGGSTVTNNYIGTNSAGTAALGNTMNGVSIGVSPGNQVTSNLISANGQYGVRISDVGSANNIVQGNKIGTDITGTVDLGNGFSGVGLVNNASGNTIGGSSATGNLISGNGQGGIEIHGFSGGGAAGNVIRGNLIGTDAAGTGALGNFGPGIQTVLLANLNFIGGLGPGEGNVIAFNAGDGVAIGTGSGNLIESNTIHSNTGLGIDLFGNDGVTPNDTGDPDTGGNDLQNFPDITSVIPGVSSSTIQGTLNSTANTSFTLQFFSNVACDPSGNGEGQTFLGDTSPPNVQTDGTGNVAFLVTVPTVVATGQAITATATRATGSPSTSEFSACFTVAGGPTPTPTVTPTPTPTVTLTITAGGPTSTPTPTPTPSLTPTPTPTVTPGGPTFTPTSTPTPTVTASATPTPTSTSVPPSATPTIIGGGGGPAPGSIPTLSGGMLALLGVILAGVALLLIRRA